MTQNGSNNINNSSNNGTEIDENLYSRQLYVLGHDAMSRMAQSNVLIVGLSGVGVEIAKNVILTGVKSVSLYDESTVSYNDLSAQFYLSEADVGKNRAQASFSKLQELNSYVSVNVVQGPLNESLLTNYSVVVFADHHTNHLIDLNEVSRRHGVKFIVAESRGVFGSVFCDFGSEFEINDKDGEQTVNNVVINVTNENPAVVFVHDDKATHGLYEGDHVLIEGVEGMEQINGRQFKVKPTGRYMFQLVDVDATHFGKYTGGGTAKQIKAVVTEKFLSLREALDNPEFLLTDFAKAERPAHVHAAFRALGDFVRQHGRLPLPHNENDAQAVLDIARSTYMDTVDQEVVLKLAYTARGNLNPMAAFIGGVAAQEVQKACSGKFGPVKQWLYIDALETLPNPLPTEHDAQPINSRYDGQVVVYGQLFQQKLLSMRNFIVGAGALGCEYLKNFAMMGVGCGPQGRVFVTDMDTIEISNLNRQFLFRRHHVGQLKSKVAALQALEMNSAMQVESLADKVAPETEAQFDDEFWDSLHAVTNALDNVQARLYVDGRCVYYKRPLLEAGTLGTKGNVQVVVPGLTESYGSQPDPPEKEIPICTLKNFPNAIEHCIQWARDSFEGFFSKVPEEVNAYLSRGRDHLAELAKQGSSKRQAMESIHESLVAAKPLSFEECVVWARFLFEDLFVSNIKQLLYTFPPGMKTSSGAPFWGGPKKPPTPVEFDLHDDTHMQFIVSAANLRASVFGLKGHHVEEYDFHKILSSIRVPEFKPKSNVHISADDKEEKERQEAASSSSSNDDDEAFDTLAKQLPEPSSLAGYRLNVVEFEKDDDTNFHMDYITATSNLRARNYKILEATKHQAKGIAGKIIPAMVTTTALITGLASFELYKLVLGKEKIEDYRNAFVNIGIPFFTLSEPMPPPKVQMHPNHPEETYTLWDRCEMDAGRDITMREFIDLFKEKYKYNIAMLSSGQSMIYSQFGMMGPNKKKLEERMSMPLSQVVRDISKREFLPKQRYFTLTAICSDDDDVDVDVPEVRYRFRF